MPWLWCCSLLPSSSFWIPLSFPHGGFALLAPMLVAVVAALEGPTEGTLFGTAAGILCDLPATAFFPSIHLLLFLHRSACRHYCQILGHAQCVRQHCLRPDCLCGDRPDSEPVSDSPCTVRRSPPPFLWPGGRSPFPLYSSFRFFSSTTPCTSASASNERRTMDRPESQNCPNTVLWYWYCSSSPCSPAILP